MREFGWDFIPENAPDKTNFKDIPAHLEELYEVIVTIYNAKTDEEKIASLFDLTTKFFVVFNDVKDLSQFLDSTNIPDNLPTGITSEKFLTQFGEDFFSYIMIEYLKNYHPFIFGFFSFAGIVKLEQIDAEENGGRLAYIRRTMEWAQFSEFLNNPSSALSSFNWNDASKEFDTKGLFDFLQDILVEMGIPAGNRLPNLTVAKNMDIPETSLDDIESILQIPIYQVADPDIGYTEAGIDVYPLPKNGSGLPGIALFPFLSGGVNFQIELGSNLILEIRGDLSTGVAILLRPGSADAKTSLFGTSGSSLSASISASVFTPPSEEKNVILGDPASTNLSYREVSNTVGIKVGNTFDLFYELNITGLRLEIRSAEGDGFISQVMPEEITADFDLILGLSKSRGFYIKGSGSIEITIPVRKSLGPIFLESIYLSLKLDESGTIKIILAATGNIALGPFAASVERLGLELKLPLKSGTKNILDNVQIGFKPPSLIGLSLDAGPISGGGALLFDPDNKRYGGILQLDIEGFVTITAIGVITTELPDGSDGFSLLGIISIEFDPGFQVGGGLVFLGLGGYLGVHRTMDTEALRDGLQKGDLDTLLFPEGDLIQRAPQIISDIEAIFPAAKDRFLVGIALKLGWPTPTIVSAELGVILEFPSPLTIAILGQLNIILPDPEFDLLKLRLDVLGIIKFDEMSVSIDGALFDSHIATMPVTGGLAMLARAGRNPAFIFSVGGFYPGFNKFPTGFRAPTERLSISISNDKNPRLRLEAYFALSSNTVQFGAALDLYVEAGPFSIQGWLNFHAMFVFSPFYFATKFSAGLVLKFESKSVFEITLALSLSGPSPWHANGNATFKFLFFDTSVRFDVKFGDEKQEVLSFVNPDNQLISKLKDFRNWSEQLPAEENRIITTREIENIDEIENTSESHPILLHPWGLLTIKQSYMPFGIGIEKAGSALIEGGSRFYKIENVNLNGIKDNHIDYIREYYTPDYYLILNEEERRSRESYEKWIGGFTVGNDGVSFSSKGVVDEDFTFDTTVYDSNNKVDSQQNVSPKDMGAMISFGSCSLSKTRHTGKKKFQGKKLGMKLDDTKYVIAQTSDLTIEKIEEIDESNPLTYTEAVQALRRFLDDNPDRENDLRVLPLHQAVIPA